MRACVWKASLECVRTAWGHIGFTQWSILEWTEKRRRRTHTHTPPAALITSVCPPFTSASILHLKQRNKAHSERRQERIAERERKSEVDQPKRSLTNDNLPSESFCNHKEPHVSVFRATPPTPSRSLSLDAWPRGRTCVIWCKHGPNTLPVLLWSK